MKAFVYYRTEASFVIEVDIPDETPADERADVAREAADEAYGEKAPSGLCHQCSGSIDLGGDWEQLEGEDGVWFE